MKFVFIFSFMLAFNLYASNYSQEEMLQQLVITGSITDADGEPLPGAAIMIKGTTQGVVANANGAYSLSVPDKNATLVFTYLGFIKQEILVGDKRVINVTLSMEMQQIDEVVVVAFGSQKKTNLTGAVSVVSSETFKERPVATATQALQGMVPGLLITQTEGGPSYNPTIQIRGMGTIGIGSTATALVIIDGMEGSINTLNPQDIESISVLKDAAASSIYGSRAPFGVLLVTTKRGASGKPVFNYNNSFRWNTPIHLPEPADSYEFAIWMNDASRNSGMTDFISSEQMQRILDYRAGKITTTNIPDPANPTLWGGKRYTNANENWFKNTYNDYALSQEHNFSLRGGNDRYKYYTSIQYMDYQGLLKFNTDEKQRYSGSAKLDVQATNWLQINTSVRFIREDYTRPYYFPNMQYLAMAGWSIIPMYDDNGYLTNNGPYLLQVRDGGNIKEQNDALYLQEQIVIEPVKNWKTFGEFNYRSNYNGKHSEWQKVYSHNRVSGEETTEIADNGIREEFRKDNFLNLNLYSEYTHQIGEHTLKAMVGFQCELFKRMDMSASQIGIMVPSLPEINLTNGYDITGTKISPSVGGSHNHWATAGYFGRLNWDYKKKYLLEANLRYDGSSRFRRESRWIWLPSVSAGWNIAFEDFWEPLRPYIGNLKLRASWGELGNQNTNNWYPTYLTLATATSNGSWLINGAKPNTAGVPGIISSTLTWERIRTVNYGVDFSMLDNRLTGSFEYYTRYTIDMLGPGMQLPQILGTSVPQMNSVDMKTHGFELAISWNDRLKNDLKYGVDIMLSNSVNEITKYPNNPLGTIGYPYRIEYGDANSYRVGTLGDLFGYKTKGIAKTNEEMNAHLATLPNGGQNLLGNSWQAGDLMYVDVNGDGIINAGARTEMDHGDLVKVGNNLPRYSLGLNLRADYKGFDVRCFFQGVLKREYFVNGLNMFSMMFGSENYITVYKTHLDYFRDDPQHPLGLNTDSYFGRSYFSRENNITNDVTKLIDRYIQNAAYLRLKNLQIGYTLPTAMTQKFAVQNLRFYVSGENLLTFTKMFKEFDPEAIDYYQNDRAQGNGYPMMKVFSFGCSINF